MEQTMKKLWIISEGGYGSIVTTPVGVFSTKEKAIKFCRKQGFKFSKKEYSFYNDGANLYRHLEGPFKLDEEES